MTTIREQALTYETPKTKNIADVDKVSTALVLEHKTVGAGTPDEFSYNFCKIGDDEYRVPNSVLKQLKAQLEERPDAEHFKVKKEGEGKTGTTYTVVLL